MRPNPFQKTLTTAPVPIILNTKIKENIRVQKGNISNKFRVFKSNILKSPIKNNNNNYSLTKTTDNNIKTLNNSEKSVKIMPNAANFAGISNLKDNSNIIFKEI